MTSRLNSMMIPDDPPHHPTVGPREEAEFQMLENRSQDWRSQWESGRPLGLWDPKETWKKMKVLSVKAPKNSCKHYNYH